MRHITKPYVTLQVGDRERALGRPLSVQVMPSDCLFETALITHIVGTSVDAPPLTCSRYLVVPTVST